MAQMLRDPNYGLAGARQTMSMLVTFEDDGVTASFPALPANTVIHGSYRYVTEAFDDTGTDLLKVGNAGNDDLYCDTGDQDLTTPGLYTDFVAGSVNARNAAAETITVRYDGQNNNATAGQVIVVVDFTIL